MTMTLKEYWSMHPQQLKVVLCDKCVGWYMLMESDSEPKKNTCDGCDQKE